MKLDFSNIYTIVFISLFALAALIRLLLDLVNYRHRSKRGSVVPEQLAGRVDQSKLAEISRYSNDKLVFSLVSYFFDNALLLIVLFSGAIPALYSFAKGITGNLYLLGAAAVVGMLLVQTLLSIPFSLYYNFVLEKKYSFNKMTMATWAADLVKGLLVSLLLSLLLFLPAIFLMESFSQIWWILVWALMMLFMVIVQLLYPTVIAPLFNKFEPLANDELKGEIERVFGEAGLEVTGLFTMDASKRSGHSNAYFTGFGRSKRVVIFDTLLEMLKSEETVAVLAHEVGHFKLNHIKKRLIGTFLAALVLLFVAYLVIGSPLIYEAFGMEEQVKFIGLFFFSLIAGPIGYLLTPFSAWFSRKAEYEADDYAKKSVGSGEPLIEALIKLNIDNLSELYPAGIYAWYYYSHPPLFKRIENLNKEIK